MEDADNILFTINRDILRYLLKSGIIKKKIRIAFDFEKELYYGEKDSHYVISIKAEKGTKKAFKWHTCAIILKGFELQVGSKIVKRREPFYNLFYRQNPRSQEFILYYRAVAV
jgi:hypothetical protein